MLMTFKLTSLLSCSYLLRFEWFGSGTLNKIIYICRSTNQRSPRAQYRGIVCQSIDV